LAQRLQAEGEKPAALVAISPIYERYLKYLTGCAELFRAGFTDVNQFTLQRTALS
jgi:cyclopropane-fatty-acyl-phospholipid synthase